MKYKIIPNVVLSAFLLMMGIMSAPVFAENINTGSTDITYNVAESYTWSAPSDITLTEDSNGSKEETGTVNVTQNTIGYGKALNVNISNDQVFELVDTANPSNKRTYTVKDGTTELSAGSKVLSVSSGTATGLKKLTVQLDGMTTEFAGTYTGTLRFVSSVKTADLISFTIDGTTYQTEEGTSWETWASGSDDYSVNSGRIAKNTEGTYLVYEDGGVGVISTNSIQEKSYHTVRMPVNQDQVVIEGETYVMLSDSWKPGWKNPNLAKGSMFYSMDLSQMNFTIVE